LGLIPQKATEHQEDHSGIRDVIEPVSQIGLMGEKTDKKDKSLYIWYG